MNEPTSPRKLPLKPILTVLIIAGLFWLLKSFGIQGKLEEALDWIAKLGAQGVILFILLYILACVLFIPGSVLTLGAGAIFGVVHGTLYVSIASTLGATAAFLVGRYLARNWVKKKIEGNQKFNAMDQAVAKEGWKIVGLTRLSPVFPFSLLNYAYGLTGVKLKDYFFASWVGMLPGTVMYVYLGSVAGALAMSGGRQKTPAEWALSIVGLMATVVVTVYITKIAKRAIHEKI